MNDIQNDLLAIFQAQLSVPQLEKLQDALLDPQVDVLCGKRATMYASPGGG